MPDLNGCTSIRPSALVTHLKNGRMVIVFSAMLPNSIA